MKTRYIPKTNRAYWRLNEHGEKVYIPFDEYKAAMQKMKGANT